MNLKNKEDQLTPEKLKSIEQYFDVRYLVPNSLILFHNYTLWRPALSDEEVRRALNEKVPTFSLSSMLVYVPLLWSYKYTL